MPRNWISLVPANPLRIHFVSPPKPAARQALRQLIDAYGQCAFLDADCIVAIGGDGTTLRVIHSLLDAPSRPVFAMRLGKSVGALGNRFDLKNLKQRLSRAREVSLSPIKATAKRLNGATETLLGINEVVISRQRLQAAKLSVRLGGREQADQVTGDGVVISTPIGSTGYNRSAGGPTLMLESPLLAVTGLAACQQTNWSSIVIGERTSIEIEVLDPNYRLVRMETIDREVREVSSVRVSSMTDKSPTLLLEDGLKA